MLLLVAATFVNQALAVQIGARAGAAASRAPAGAG